METIFNEITTQEIFDEIIAVKEGGEFTELDELNSTSSVAVWRLFIWIFSFFSKTIKELFESFKLYIENVFASNQVGTLLWWINQIKAFQYGDELEFIDDVFKYAVIDESKHFVKQAALESEEKTILFKVAKEDGGSLVPLTETEQAALTAYINKKKFPGTFFVIVSEQADNLKLNYKIFYNAEKLKADIETAVTNAVNDYINNIIFNGRFSHTELTDKLQEIDGIINPVYKIGYGKPYATSEADYVLIEDYYSAAAGYFQLTELTLEFVADV